MRLVIAYAFCIAAALSAPAEVTIVKKEYNISDQGYDFIYQTSDGVARSETGVIKNPGSDNEYVEVKGDVSWTAPDGQLYKLSYLADQNGYQPTADHLPESPAV